MIIPRFHLTQNDESVTLNIYAKYVDISNLSFDVIEDAIEFFCKPYYLRLKLPGNIESEPISSKYVCEDSEFIFVLKKTEVGKHFKNLSLINSLLCPKKVPVQSGTEILEIGEDHTLWAQTKSSAYQYGFAMKGMYDFHRIIDEFDNIFKIDPRTTDLKQRKKLLIRNETLHFSEEHYECDNEVINEDISNLINMQSPWSALNPTEEVKFTENELDILKDLPCKNYDLDKTEKMYCYTSLIDILFAYCYDFRTTYFEHTCESGWTISTLASSLTWLNGFESVEECLISAFRRSVIYPLYRNFSLSYVVFQDLKHILNLGEVVITKILIEIYNIFNKGDYCHYIYNDIFIKDYIIYISKWNQEEWKEVVDAVLKMDMKRKYLNLRLELLDRNILEMYVNNRRYLDPDDSEDEDFVCEEHFVNKTKENSKDLLNNLIQTEFTDTDKEYTELMNKLSSIKLCDFKLYVDDYYSV